MATKIKVKKITDLERLKTDDDVDGIGTAIPGAQKEDQIIVAHYTNANDKGNANTGVFHTNAMELSELAKFVGNELVYRYASLEDLEKFREDIEQRLKEAEEEMAKGKDIYSGNYYVDDSGNCSFITSTGNWPRDNEAADKGYYRYTQEFTFKSTGSANCHLTIYRKGTTDSIAASANLPNAKMFAKIQVKSRSGQWKSICQQPVQSSHGGFDIELHGYFYAGTAIRGAICTDNNAMTDANSKIYFNNSFLQVTRFSSDKGFPEHSFDWWVSNNSALESSKTSPQPISADGFLKFSGKYWHNRAGKVGNAQTDYLDKSKNWINHYQTDAVYAKYYKGEKEYFLGNTESDHMSEGTKGGVTDDFSGKYYYITAGSDASRRVSAFTVTDFTFTDDTKKNYADSGGGWHNATLIQYVEFSELSIVVDNFSEGVQPYTYEQLLQNFSNNSENTSERPHRFIYEGGLAPYLSATAAKASTFSKYMGANARNSAMLEFKSIDGTPGCYLKETMGSREQGDSQTTTYSFVPTAANGQISHTLIRDYQLAKNAANINGGQNPIRYQLDMLNENIEWLAATRDIYRFNAKVVKGDAKTDLVTQTAVKNHLANEVSSGWALVSVDMSPAPDGGDITVQDFGFAACPRLSSFSFPKGVGLTGRYTFAVNPTLLKEVSCTSDKTVETKQNVPSSRLSSVDFWSGPNQGEVTHVYGINGNGETWATFANCSSLKRAEIQNTDLQSLGNHTFFGCSSLVSVEVPDTCTAIGDAAFQNCKSLSCVILPSKISKFGAKVFNGCPFLTAANGKKQNNYEYKLGTHYNITIKLAGPEQNYVSGTNPDKMKIWNEIQDLVGFLQKEKMGQTTNSSGDTAKGRRFYIVPTNSQTIANKQLVFNTIAYQTSKAGVFNQPESNIIDYTENSAKQC